MRIAGLIVAAGSGNRFGFKKQFAMLNDRWVLEYSVDVFRKMCDDIVVVAQKSDMRKIKERFEFVEVVEGGRERMHSVYNGLESLNCDIVAVHDAARPLIDESFVKAVLEVAVINGSAVPVLGIPETIKRVENGKIVSTLDRKSIYVAQTPQAFDFARLKSAYSLAIKKYKNYTDESSIWEEFYGPVSCVKGSRKNIKITLREDLEMAKCLLG